MTISVEFNEEEIRDLIDLYLEKVKTRRFQAQEIDRDIRNTTAKITQLKQVLNRASTTNQILPLENDRVYSEKWQWVRKIEFAIESLGKALTANEIYDFLTDFEPEFATDKRKTMGSISGTLSLKSGTYDEKKDFVRIKNDGEDFTYQLRKAISDFDAIFLKSDSVGNNIDVVDDLPF